jgi:hypothetical protein
MWTDIAVLQPKSSYKKGRPDWLFQGEVSPVRLDISDIDLSFPLMVLAFNDEEDYTKAIPVDVLEVKDRNEKIHLALSSGHYNIILSDTEQKAKKFELSVK